MQPPPSAQSQYSGERPSQPPNEIADVDVGANWFSPMQPVAPYGPPSVTRPREWDYTVGYNLNFIPEQFEFFQMLRAMRGSWGVMATVIETRKDEILTMPWTIQVRDKPKGTNKWTKEIVEFLRRPDGKNSFDQWMRLWLDDLLVIDVPTLYVGDRDMQGRPLRVECIDGCTIKPLIDDAGRRPDSVIERERNGYRYAERQPAYQQIIKGLPIVDLDETELIRKPMRPLPYMPVFGYAPPAQILSEATAATRKTFFEVQYWQDGTIPDMIMTVPDAWGVRQIAAFQAHFDALLSGNLNLKSKVRFVPNGMKPFEIKSANGGELYAPIDEIWIRLCCFAYGVSPTPFVRQINRATAETAQQEAQQQGLRPLMKFIKEDFMDHLIQDQFGYEDVEFYWDQRPEVDPLKQAQVHQIQLAEGLRNRDECRDDIGEEPLPNGLGKEYTVKTMQGVVSLENAIAAPPPAPGAFASPGGVPRASMPPAGGGAQGQQQKPAKGKPSAAAVAKFLKADTVSTGTGLVWYDQGDAAPKRHDTKTCGGPMLCRLCKRKWARKHGAEWPSRGVSKTLDATRFGGKPEKGDLITVESDQGVASNAPWTSRVIEADGWKVKVEYDDGEVWYAFDPKNVTNKHRNRGISGPNHWFFAKGKLANQIDHEADKALPSPSPAQIDSGIYPKGHIAWNGLDLTIETAAGRTRHTTDHEGKHHHVLMPAHYGYIRGTMGNDGMQVDCYMGPHPKSDRVWVIDQVHAHSKHGHTAGQFDETKCMLGYKSEAEATAAYLEGWDDPADARAHFGGVTELSVAAFKEWLKTGDMAKPIGKLEPRAA